MKTNVFRVLCIMFEAGLGCDKWSFVKDKIERMELQSTEIISRRDFSVKTSKLQMST